MPVKAQTTWGGLECLHHRLEYFMKTLKLASISLLFVSIAALGGAAMAGTMEMKKETGKFVAHGNTLEVGANSLDVLCPKGGVFVSMHDEHVIEMVTFYCMNDATVDKLIASLQDGKAEAAKIRTLNE
jgi:hypothetical protein